MASLFQVDSLFGMFGLDEELIAASGVASPFCATVILVQSNNMSNHLIEQVSKRTDLGIVDTDSEGLPGTTLVVINVDDYDDSFYVDTMSATKPLEDGRQPSSLSKPVFGYITEAGQLRYIGQTCSHEGVRGRYPWRHEVNEVTTVAAVEANVGQDGRKVFANLLETLIFNELGVNQNDWKNEHCVVGASPLGGSSDFSQDQRSNGGGLYISLSFSLSLFLSLSPPSLHSLCTVC